MHTPLGTALYIIVIVLQPLKGITPHYHFMIASTVAIERIRSSLTPAMVWVYY